MEVMHESSKMDFHSPRVIWLYSLLNAQYGSSGDQQWVPNMAPFFGEISLLPAGKLIYWPPEPHPSWKGSALSLLAWLYLPCTQFFCYNYHRQSCRMPYSLSWYSTHSTVSKQTTHFTAKKWLRRLMRMEFTDLTMFLVTQKSWVDRKVEWPFLKMQLQCQLSGNIMQNWVKVLQKTIYALKQCSPHTTVSHRVKIHECRN